MWWIAIESAGVEIEWCRGDAVKSIMVWGWILRYTIIRCSSLPFADCVVRGVFCSFGVGILDGTSCSFVRLIYWRRRRTDEAAAESRCKRFEKIGKPDS